MGGPSGLVFGLAFAEYTTFGIGRSGMLHSLVGELNPPKAAGGVEHFEA